MRRLGRGVTLILMGHKRHVVVRGHWRLLQLSDGHSLCYVLGNMLARLRAVVHNLIRAHLRRRIGNVIRRVLLWWVKAGIRCWIVHDVLLLHPFCDILA